MFNLLAADGDASLGAWVLAITTVITSMTASIVSIVVAVRTKDVQRLVQTGNGKTIGESVTETNKAVADALDPTTQTTF